MNREELILSGVEIVNNLVRKYNNHNPDEDLQSTGMIAVVECVDRCITDGMTDIDEIHKRCNVWARNAILTEVYKQKIKYSDSEEDYDNAVADADMTDLLLTLDKELTPKEKEIFDMLLFGYTKEEIMNKLNIKKTIYYDRIKSIKNKINGKNT
jgi:DNA-directed RNA polymerase specialized sigma subunit